MYDVLIHQLIKVQIRKVILLVDLSLDKQPGIRPIGIGKVLRRIIGKTILSVIKPNLMASAGNLQLCAAQPAGCESAIHAITEIFKEDETDGLLLIDAENAFNSLNRSVSIKVICYWWTRNSFCRRNNTRRPADNANVCYWYNTHVIPT